MVIIAVVNFVTTRNFYTLHAANSQDQHCGHYPISHSHERIAGGFIGRGRNTRSSAGMHRQPLKQMLGPSGIHRGLFTLPFLRSSSPPSHTLPCRRNLCHTLGLHLRHRPGIPPCTAFPTPIPSDTCICCIPAGPPPAAFI